MVFARCAALLGSVGSALAGVSKSNFPHDQTQYTSPTTLTGGFSHPVVETNFDYPIYRKTAQGSCPRFGGVQECTVGLNEGPYKSGKFTHYNSPKWSSAEYYPAQVLPHPKSETYTHNDEQLPSPVGIDAYWRCGNAPTKTMGAEYTTEQQFISWSPWAGIEILRGDNGHKSLDWVRQEELANQLSSANCNTPECTARRQVAKETTFSDLFCGDYLSRYLNPRKGAGDYAGVCIRDLRQGRRWDAIVTADKDAKKHWERFGNVEGNLAHHFTWEGTLITTQLPASKGGYMKSAPLFRTTSNRSMNTLWGSGGVGSVPANWCGAYMKEMLCHVAFPQYAGGAPDADKTETWNKCLDGAALAGADPTTGTLAPADTDAGQAAGPQNTQGHWYRMATATNPNGNNPDQTMRGQCPSNGALVRPVCAGTCDSMFGICNRFEAYYCEGKSGTESGPCKRAFSELQTTYSGNPAGTQPYMNLGPLHYVNQQPVRYNQCLHGDCNEDGTPDFSAGVRASVATCYNNLGVVVPCTDERLRSNNAESVSWPYVLEDKELKGRKFKETNQLWCEMWNRGFGLAQAGTGVGVGWDEGVEAPDGSARFCATWSSSSRFVPTLLLTAIISSLAAVALHC